LINNKGHFLDHCPKKRLKITINNDGQIMLPILELMVATKE